MLSASCHTSTLQEIDRAFAQVLGIQLSYVNNDGAEVLLEKDVFYKIALELLPTSLEFGGQWDRAFLEKLLRHKYQRRVPANAVVWDASELVLTCHSLNAEPFRSLKGELSLEGGELHTFEVQNIAWEKLPNPAEPLLSFPLWQARIATGLRVPPGYHSLKTSGGEETQVICAPQCLPAAERKSWGAFVPTYALRSKKDWGAGSYTELKDLSLWLASQGASTVATLPLLPAFLENWKCDPSPYSPASRLFWNEFYVDPTQSPEWGSSSKARALFVEASQKIEEWRRAEFVPYFEIAQLKKNVLFELSKTFFQHGEFSRLEAATRSKPKLMNYARFRANCQTRGESWWCWKADEKSSLETAVLDESLVNYYAYTQMLAVEQMGVVASECRTKGLSFYLDLPVGVHSDSYDVWENPKQYALKLSAGAPPDPFFTKGQDWGFPPFRPIELLNDCFAHFKEILRHHLSQASLLRLDHVMGLHRIYVIPHGVGADRGGYIRFPFEEQYAVLLLEASRAGARLVGEDLGTVPEEVRTAIDAHLLSRLFVFQYEAQPSKTGVVSRPAPNTVATLNTHDMPMWAAYWGGLDLPDRKDLGLLNEISIVQEAKARQEMRDAWVKVLETRYGLKVGASEHEIFEATMLSLAASDSELTLVTLEDMWLETRPQNTPGTHLERKNWQGKCRLSIDELRASAPIQDFLRRLSHLRP